MSRFTVALVTAAILVVPGMAEDGASIYRGRCVSCHGADGSSNTPAGHKMNAPNLQSVVTQKKSDVQLTDVVASGGRLRRASHAYSSKGLSMQQIEAVVSHVRTLRKHEP